MADEVYSSVGFVWKTLPAFFALMLLRLEWKPNRMYWKAAESVTLGQYKLIMLSSFELWRRIILYDSIRKVSATEHNVEVYVGTKKKPVLIQCERLNVDPQALCASIQARIDAAGEKE